MTSAKLHRNHNTVVHSSTHRTRLRVPKSKRKPARLRQAQQAIERLPGVKSVEVNEQTGSMLIHHADSPDMLAEITSALQESAPEILAALLIPGGEEAEIGMGVISNLFKRLVIEPLSSSANSESVANGGAANSESIGLDFPANSVALKRFLPLAFVAAGAWKLMQQEALLAGLAPIACFYYGFDLYWKLRQENVQARIEGVTDSLSAKQKEEPERKTTAERP